MAIRGRRRAPRVGVARGQVGALHVGVRVAHGAHAAVPRGVGHDQGADRGRLATAARGHATVRRGGGRLPHHAARRGLHAHRLQPHPVRA